MRLTPMLTDEPNRPNASRVQTTQVLVRCPNTLYDLQTTNLADIYPPTDPVNINIPKEEPECDLPSADHYTHPIMEAMDYPPTLNCYDGHHATNKKTTKNKFKVSLLAAPSQMNESLNQVSCLTLHASIGIN